MILREHVDAKVSVQDHEREKNREGATKETPVTAIIDRPGARDGDH